MSAILILVPLSIVVASGFLLGFIWAVKSGQFEDTYTPSLRLLMEEDTLKNEDDRAETGGRTTKKQ